jgi:hypothetical protein
MRFDFVAHSMGALVLRWWLMHGAPQPDADGTMPPPDWAGARRTACGRIIRPRRGDPALRSTIPRRRGARICSLSPGPASTRLRRRCWTPTAGYRG